MLYNKNGTLCYCETMSTSEIHTSIKDMTAKYTKRIKEEIINLLPQHVAFQVQSSINSYIANDSRINNMREAHLDSIRKLIETHTHNTMNMVVSDSMYTLTLQKYLDNVKLRCDTQIQQNDVEFQRNMTNIEEKADNKVIEIEKNYQDKIKSLEEQLSSLQNIKSTINYLGATTLVTLGLTCYLLFKK